MKPIFIAIGAVLLAVVGFIGLGTPGSIISYTEFNLKQGAPTASAPANELVLPVEVNLQVAETFVHIGYGLHKDLNFQSTSFLTPRIRTSQASHLIRMVTSYNEFNGERVALAVEKLKGKVSGVEFGREGSPVLYIELPFWTHQREEHPLGETGTKISDRDTDKFIADLRRVFVDELNADELSVSHRRVRVWWD